MEVMKIQKKRNWFSKNLVTVFFLAGLMIGLLAIQFLPTPFTGKFYELLITAVVLFFWGCIGLVVIIRRELLQFPVLIKGKLALIYGMLIMAFCWALALIFLVMAISKIL